MHYIINVFLKHYNFHILGTTIFYSHGNRVSLGLCLSVIHELNTLVNKPVFILLKQYSDSALKQTNLSWDMEEQISLMPADFKKIFCHQKSTHSFLLHLIFNGRPLIAELNILVREGCCLAGVNQFWEYWYFLILPHVWCVISLILPHVWWVISLILPHVHWVISLILPHVHWVISLILPHVWWVISPILPHVLWVISLILPHVQWVISLILPHVQWVISLILPHVW